MMDNDIDLQDEISLAFKKSTEDKLAWKLEIAAAIRDCRRSKGTFDFKNRVMGLEDIIYFNIPGYRLKDELDALKQKVKTNLNEMVEEKRKLDGIEFHRRAYIAKFKIEKERYFWDNYFRGIIQILGDHNLLFDTEKYVHIKEVKQLDDQ